LARIKHHFPTVSVAAIVLIIAVVVALNHDRLGSVGLMLALAVVLHNAFGLAGGYALGALLGRPHRVRIALAIEVGMQNSGLAVALALKHFTPLAALPGALFSVWHNVTGSALAAHWVRRMKRP
ncbi:MAG TPA: bile acid:sodium symporter, partial [Gammaproteobacteria bacterium]|nr:bile acid:sodium symporter [Gammaproteobacteria bacterium]